MRQYASIDIGGTSIKSGVVCADGTIHAGPQIPTPHGADAPHFLEQIFTLAEPLCSGCSGLGISVLGTWDGQQQKITGACDNLPVLHGMPLRASMEQRLRLPVAVSNDVNAAAIGEARWGAGRGLQQFYCMTLGTGIGGAYVSNGRLVSGANHQAGEIGYLSCEGRGYETAASTRALLQTLRQLAWAKGKEDRVLFAAAMQGEPVCQPAWEAWLHQLACGICQIIYVLDPGTVLIGGGVSEWGTRLTEKVKAQVELQLLPDFRGKTRIIPAALGNSACLLGAVSPLWETV